MKMINERNWRYKDNLIVAGLFFLALAFWVIARASSPKIDIWDALEYLNAGYSYILHGTSMPGMIRIGVFEELGAFPVNVVEYPNTLFSVLVGALSIFFFEYPTQIPAFVLAAVFSAIGVASLYVLARKYLSINSSLLFVLAATVSPLLWHSLARPLTDPVAWGLLFFSAAYAVSNNRKTVVVAFLLTALILVRFPMFVVIPFFPLLMMKTRSLRSLAVQFATLVIWIALFYLAYGLIFNAVFLPNQDTRSLDNAASFYTSFAANSLGRLSIENILWQVGHVFSLIIKFSIGGPLALYLIAGIWGLVSIWEKKNSRVFVTLIFLFLVGLIIIAVPSAYLAYRTWLGIDPRYFIYATPFFALAAWLAFDQIRSARPKLAGTLEIGSCILAIFAIPFAMTSPQGERYFSNLPSTKSFVAAVTASDLQDVYDNAQTWFGADPVIVTNFNSAGINSKSRTAIYVPEIKTFQESPVASQIDGIVVTNLNGTDWDVERVCTVDDTCFERVYTSENAHFFAFRRDSRASIEQE